MLQNIIQLMKLIDFGQMIKWRHGRKNKGKI